MFRNAVFSKCTCLFVSGHRSLAVPGYKRTSKELEESVSSVLYGNSTPSKKVAVQVEEVNSEKSVKEESHWHEELATTTKKSDNKAPHNITINFRL